jgi:sugar/nucleoside kinase (ribokinase family)
MKHYAAVIGQMNIDFIFQGVKALPNPGEEVFASGFKICLGGGPMVIPYHLTRLGVPTRFGTFMGTDFESKVARDLLLSLDYANVEILPVEAVHPVVATSVLSTKDERSFICYNSNVDESNVDSKVLLDFFEGSKVAYFPKNLEVAATLVATGCKLILDVSWVENMTLSDFFDRLKFVEYFTPNDKEIKKLCAEDDLLKCMDILEGHLANPIIKLGANGVLTKHNGEYLRVPALSHFESIDPTGAGDNFLAGLIFGLHEGLTFIDSLKMGNIVGGLATEVIGCYRSDLTREMVLSLFNQYPEVDVVKDSSQLDKLLIRE